MKHVQETEARQIGMNTKLKHLKLALLLGEDGECNLASPVTPIWTKSGLRNFLVYISFCNEAEENALYDSASWKCWRADESALEMLTRS